MTPEVYPISLTRVDWTMLLHASKCAFDRDVARPLDEAGIKLNGLRAEIICLGNLLNPKSKLEDFVRNNEDLLKHVHLTVLVKMATNDLLGVVSKLRVEVSANMAESSAIVSGSIKDWKELCVDLSELNSNTNQRQFANQVSIIINAFGLADIWFHFGRRSLADGTFLLEHKS